MKRIFGLIICALILIGSLACYGIADNNNRTHKQIIFISDTQIPLWYEEIFTKTHRNEEATEILLNSILKDTLTSAVFFLGDVTAMSSIDSKWKLIDPFLASLNLKNIPAYAVMGNHDYLLSGKKGENNFRKRFPSYVRTGYVVYIERCAIMMLNSNFNELSVDEIEAQEAWYKKEMNRLDNETTVSMIIVACHHSPYSNSSIVGGSKKVRKVFVETFRKSRKAKLFLSGHAHTFQHFKDAMYDKHFLVIGGGGGLLHKLNGEECEGMKDLTGWGTNYRMFHYLKCIILQNELIINVMMLTENLEGPYLKYKLRIPFSTE